MDSSKDKLDWVLLYQDHKSGDFYRSFQFNTSIDDMEKLVLKRTKEMFSKLRETVKDVNDHEGIAQFYTSQAHIPYSDDPSEEWTDAIDWMKNIILEEKENYYKNLN